ncbi:hypothetical protein BV22DRAFT_1051201 [Leucogyrophana mollusca]|uniref:Uncharacterized protein n=1 Tax=Leucogyrophana mollusca TaxID=85980 RepID=A0ACB8B0L7_9AGAM|nr:hypothetical protein BV22DRAFT_1051201 [Leucogyrophana mollusca]
MSHCRLVIPERGLYIANRSRLGVCQFTPPVPCANPPVPCANPPAPSAPPVTHGGGQALSPFAFEPTWDASMFPDLDEEMADPENATGTDIKMHDGHKTSCKCKPEMISEAEGKKGEVKIVLTENKVCFLHFSSTYANTIHLLEQTMDTDNENESDEQNEEPDPQRAKKKKTEGPTVKESEQDKIIKNLQNMYRCKDKTCPYSICWAAGSTGARHVHLTFAHIRSWAAAIQEKEDGVSMDHLPHEKKFDAPHGVNVDDDSCNILALAKCCRNQLTQDTNTQLNVTINIAGLADLIAG